MRYLAGLAWPVATFAIALVVALALRRLLVGWVERRVAGQLSFASAFLRSIRVPSLLWCFALAIAVAVRFSELTDRQMHLASVWIVVFLIVSFTLAAGSVGVRTITAYGEKNAMPFAVAGLTRVLIRGVILLLGGMMLLHYLGISITPLITAFGVGGLAVALALQDTLANLFAGIHILVETPITVGDTIQLSSGEEGVVTDIGWRTTRVRTGANNIIVIPNTKITSGILTNYNLPTQRVSAEVVIVAGHDADADLVAEIALQAASSTAGVLPDPPPVVLFDPGVTPTHLQFKVILHVPNHMSRGPVQSAVRASVLERFRRQGVPLPNPSPGRPLTS